MGRDAIGCGMQRRAEDIVCSSKQGAFGVKTCNINLIAHGSGEGVGHTADHVHVRAVQRHDLIMAMQVLSVIPAAEVGAVGVGACIAVTQFAESHHVGIDLIQAGGVGVIDHVRGETAGQDAC